MRLSEPAALDSIRRHNDAVMRTAARRVGDPHLAADPTSDISLAALDPAHTPLTLTSDTSNGPTDGGGAEHGHGPRLDIHSENRPAPQD
ncbi:hypothetical protein SAMN05421505_1344 [Sinosporangium album]|uniref:Uncharacterized protein n=1 Tax=Sinosporangium album TaxID=504805 RepID=A0A1G8HTP1_9ACTN|nr:hypothetical protein [Sinosporangium album]SDI10033.1 hypothetical protein SAMN05421505_1344 [Sinosporangium album]